MTTKHPLGKGNAAAGHIQLDRAVQIAKETLTFSSRNYKLQTCTLAACPVLCRLVNKYLGEGPSLFYQCQREETTTTATGLAAGLWPRCRRLAAQLHGHLTDKRSSGKTKKHAPCFLTWASQLRLSRHCFEGVLTARILKVTVRPSWAPTGGTATLRG